MAATIKDIAGRTGLGLATISKYLNGGNVRAANRAAIDEAIAALGYTANNFARGLKTNRSRTVGVVIPELSNLFVTTIITEIEDALRSRGYAALICDCRTDEALEAEAIRFLLGKGVDAILNMPVGGTGRHLSPALAKGTPVVLLDRAIEPLASAVDTVMIDNISAAREATAYLLRMGHRRVGIIVGPEAVYTAQRRLEGYRQAMRAAGIEPDPALTCSGGYTIEGGYACAKRLLAARADMTALFVTNYEMTLGAVIGFNELRVRMPDDVSVIGFDNLPLSRVIRPALTTVAQPMTEIGRAAARLALIRLESPSEQPERLTVLEARLVPGESVREMAMGRV